MSTIIDLTLTLCNGVRGVSLEPNTSIAQEGFNTTNLHLYSHAGTHMDAPLHFIDGAGTIEHIALENCIGPAEVVDVSYKEPTSFITIDDLLPYAARIQPGTRLLLRTDWDRFADQDNYRSGMPRISAQLASWLVEQGIILLGLETPSVASLLPENRAELTKVHRILLGAGIVIIESLTNLRHLPNRVHFIGLPLKVCGCDGTPIRAVAVIDPE